MSADTLILPAEKHCPAFPTAPLALFYTRPDTADDRSGPGKRGRTCWPQTLHHSLQLATGSGTSEEVPST